jgi:phosphoribosylamine--glycine ligase
MAELDVTFSDQAAVTVVLASEGYPRSPLKGRSIGGLEKVVESTTYRKAWVNFAGVSGSQSTGFIASGGRVLSCTAMGDNLADTQKEAYKLIQQLSLQGGHFRTDIAHRALRR